VIIKGREQGTKSKSEKIEDCHDDEEEVREMTEK